MKTGWGILVGLIALCTAVELVLQASELNIFGAGNLRSAAYYSGAFWPGLLQSWQPNFSAQPYLMFLSYGFLHGGLVHLVSNMLVLWQLGYAVLTRVRVGGLLILYFSSQFGGAVFFGIFAEPSPPMVGASGAIFGLAGGLLAWSYVDRYTQRKNLWPVAWMVFGLVALNVVQWWVLKGQIAWETHLGGALSGWIVAMLIDPRPRAYEDDDEDDRKDDLEV